MYGLIQTIVISECNLGTNNIFPSARIKSYLYRLVSEIGMQVANMDEPYKDWIGHGTEWEEFKRGVSANIFIETSNISVHACDPQRTIRICIFTCKQHDEDKAVKFSEEYWEGNCMQSDITEVM